MSVRDGLSPPEPTLPPDDALEAYADAALRVGVALRPGRRLLIRAPLAGAPLVRRLVRQAYRLGSPYVDVHWSDAEVTRQRFLEAPEGSFEELPEGRAETLEAIAERGDAVVSVLSSDPELLREADPERVATARRASQRSLRGFKEHQMRQSMPWTIVAVPNPAWAAKVFPAASPERAQARLWSAILAAARIDGEDPVAAWREHVSSLRRRSTHLNERRYRALHFRGPGTDLTVGLADGHRWMGGATRARDGTEFVPNLPTEEVFTTPHRERVDGTVRATKPLVYGGRVIEPFALTFADGRVVEVKASGGGEVLERMIDSDEGAGRLGEVALVSVDSPIHRSGVLFFQTLFDENAASHLAFGRGFPMAIEGGERLSQEELAERGLNDSMMHVDFMVGSEDLDVDGLLEQGRAEPLMRAGRFVI